MGGKTAQTSSQVQIPPEVLARYNSVNATAEQAAAQPFQQYSTDPNAFVAPVNQQQQTGINAVNQSSNTWQPYFDQATAATKDAANRAYPYFDAANASITAANSNGQAGTQAAYHPLEYGRDVSQGLAGQAQTAFTQAPNAAQPYLNNATGLGAQAYAGAQPFNQVATGLAAAGAGPVNPGALDIPRYMTPYLDTVMKGAMDPLIQQQGYDRSSLQGNQIMRGSFGGDRAGITSAVLQGQQDLARGQLASGILTDAYNQATGTAQQQQGVGLGAAQANRAALQQASGQIAGIGQQQYGQGSGTAELMAGLGQQQFGMGAQTGQNLASLGAQQFSHGAAESGQMAALAQQMYAQGATTSQVQSALGQSVYGVGSGYGQQLAALGQGIQQSGLTGAQAQIGAGTLQQQTDQAGLSALYNQFQQQQGYPFQVAQFLGNIAMGTGSLSGSTTINTQPVQGFLSDERTKEDIEPIGKTFDGQNIVKFRYKNGDPRKQIGLIAQEVEQHRPDAVGLAGGSDLKVVDYDKATEGAAARGKFATGGIPSYDLASILQAQQGMYSPMAGGLGGGGYGAGIAGKMGDFKLTPSEAPKIKETTLKDVAESAQSLKSMYDLGEKVYDKVGLGGGDYVPRDIEAADIAGSATGGDLTGLGELPDISDSLDADMFFADGGGVGGGQPPYPLADTYQSYLGQQRMHPFSGAGIYGDPLIASGVAGPYGSMLEGPDLGRKPLTGEPPTPKKTDPVDAAKKSLEALRAAMATASKSAEEAPQPQARAGFAVGGMPYETGDGNKGYVPEALTEKYTLPTPQAPSAGGGGGLGDLASIAKLGMLFLNKGGRVGKAGGGEAEEMPDAPSLLDMFSTPKPPPGTPYIDAPLFGAPTVNPNSIPDGPGRRTISIPEGGLAPNAPGTSSISIAPEAVAGSTGTPRVLDEPPVLRAPSGPARTRPGAPLLEAANGPPAGLAPRNAASLPGPTPRPGLASDAPLEPLSGGVDVKPHIAPRPEGGLQPPAPAPVAAAPVPQSAKEVQQHLDTIKNSPDGPDWMARNQDWLLPVLKGVGAATLYPGKDLFGALAYGAMQGAESYSDTQNQIQQRALAKAQTGATQQQAASSAANMATNGQFVVLADGSRMLQGQYRSLVAAGKAPPLWGERPGQTPYSATRPPAAGPGGGTLAQQYVQQLPGRGPEASSQSFGDAGRSYIAADYNRLSTMDPTALANERAISQKHEAEIGEMQQAAYNQGGTLNQLAAALMKIPESGMVSGGPYIELKASLLNRANDVIRTMAPKLGINPNEYLSDPAQRDALGWVTASNKLNGFLRVALAAGADQNSLGALQETASMIPGAGIPKDQATKVLAGMYIDKQRAIDEGNYLNDYKRHQAAQYPGQTDLYLAQNARTAFRKDHSDSEYGRYKDAVTKLLDYKMANGQNILPEIYAGRVRPAVIDMIAGVPGTSRFLMNQ